MELLASLAGIRMQHVPYKGMGPIFDELFHGQLQAPMSPVAWALPHVRSGRLEALAIATPQRSSPMPEVPTVIEAAIPGCMVDTRHGLVAPAGTPAEVVQRLATEVRAPVTPRSAPRATSGRALPGALPARPRRRSPPMAAAAREPGVTQTGSSIEGLGTLLEALRNPPLARHPAHRMRRRRHRCPPRSARGPVIRPPARPVAAG
jgi:hypothetical protein